MTLSENDGSEGISGDMMRTVKIERFLATARAGGKEAEDSPGSYQFSLAEIRVT